MISARSRTQGESSGLWVSFIIVAILSLCLCPGVAEAQQDVSDRLHPLCSDDVFKPTAMGPNGVTQMASVSGEALAVDCFSHVFLPETSTSPTDPPPCSNVQLAEGRAVLEIIDPTVSSGANDVSVNLGSLYAGSLYGSTFSFESSRTFRFLLVFPPHRNCTARIEASTFSTYVPRLRRNKGNLPFVMQANPLVMFRNDPYTITFDTSTPMSATDVGLLALMALPTTKRCEDDAHQEFIAGAWSAPRWVNASRFTWSLTTTKPREMFVCLRPATSSRRFETAAVVEAYGANPAFFKLDHLSSGQSMTTYELTFEGHALDSSADVVRLIDASQHFCGSDALPSKYASVGAVTTYNADATMVRVTVQAARLFLVCYYHASAREWVRVPNFDSLSRDVVSNTSDPDQQRLNHELAPGDGKPGISECASAPLQAASGSIQQDSVVVLVIDRAPLPASFPQSVASLLCLPSTDYLTIYDTLRVDSNSGSQTEMTIGVECNPDVCSDDERMRALVANAHKLSGFVSVELDTFSGLASRRGTSGDDDASDSAKPAIIVGIVVGLVVIAVLVAIIVYLAVRRREADRRAALAEEDAHTGPVVGTIVHVQSGAALAAVPRGTNGSPPAPVAAIEMAPRRPLPEEEDGQAEVPVAKASAPLPPSGSPSPSSAEQAEVQPATNDERLEEE